MDSTTPSGSVGSASAAWRLSGASRHQDRDTDSDEDHQKKNRRRKRKPLPPLDLLGVGNMMPAASGPGAFSALHASPHPSAFSVPKPRQHHYVMVDDSPQMSMGSLAPAMSVTTGVNMSGGSLTNLGGSPIVAVSPPHQHTIAMLPKRAISPAMQNPLAVAPSSSRTVTVCCCIQVQFESGGRRCTRTFLWLVLVMSLICVFSVATVLLSYYSVDVFQARSGRMASSSGLLRKLNSAFASPPDSWTSSWPSVLDGGAKFDPLTVLTNLFEPDDLIPTSGVQDFILQASLWSREHLKAAPRHVLQMYGTDFLNARALFPDAKSYFVMHSLPCPTVEDIQKCDVDACQKMGKEFASQAFRDLEKEGFVTVNTTTRFARANPLGMLPALLASIKALGADIVHVEDSPVESGLSCLKFALKQASDEFLMVYCGGLDEASDEQRVAIRMALRPLHPLALFVRASNYALHPDVRPEIVPVALMHFKAMLLALSSLVVQDDSGLPFLTLTRHASDLTLWGEYRGLGDPELSGLQKVPGAVVKQLYQSELAKIAPAGPLPFRFGYRSVIGPSQQQAASAELDKNNVFVKRANFKGSHLLVAHKK